MKLHCLEEIVKSEWKLRSSDCFGGGLRTPPGRSRRCFYLILQKKKIPWKWYTWELLFVNNQFNKKILQTDTFYNFIHLSFRISRSMSLFPGCPTRQDLKRPPAQEKVFWRSGNFRKKKWLRKVSWEHFDFYEKVQRHLLIWSILG